MQYPLILFAALLSTHTDAWAIQGKGNEDFDYLLLAHFWPSTSCVYFHNKHQDCFVPESVKGWTIHGLWPSIPGEEGPEYCNDSMKFDCNEIQSLSQRLAVSWPLYEKGAEKTELWKHEWEKHGTCALSLPILRGEFRYFSQTLNLHDTISISKYLEDAGITPSTTQTYVPQKVFDAVNKGFGNVPKMTCIHDTNTEKLYLEQVWLCYNKAFQPIDCPDASASKRSRSTLYFKSKAELDASASVNHFSSTCPTDKGVYYLPLPNRN